MKKIFTLLFAVSIVSIASAQSRDFDHGKQAAGYSLNKQSALQQINHDYDYKIAAVRMDRHLRSWEKSKQIRNLENQRDAAIQRLQFSFEKDNHFYGDNKVNKHNGRKW
ncbi:MAG: hypothetical protein ABJB86_16125 [Bacteroidota bacterium]